MQPPRHLASRLAEARSVMFIGGLDTGKTTLARRVAAEALAKGRTVAYVDADVGNTTVGPPTCVGLKLMRTRADLESLAVADDLRFVGGITSARLVLQAVTATAVLCEEARLVAELVLIDTDATVSGVAGETLKYHMTELARPELVVALQRGAELEPIIGMLRRFFSVEVIAVPADPDVIPASPEERAMRRAVRLKKAFAPPLERWRVRPTVFAPTLPVGLDLARLDGMLVGVHDDRGRCRGLGRLEYSDGHLRVLTNAGEGMRGLRLGSARIDLDTLELKPVNLREVMFGV